MIADEERKQARELREKLGIGYTNGTIGISEEGFVVYIWNKVKKPDIDTWYGKSVEYRIGGGKPKAA